MRFYIVTNGVSDGARALSLAFADLGHPARRIILDRGDRISPRRQHGREQTFIINWGSGRINGFPEGSASNNPVDVAIASNKKAFLQWADAQQVGPRTPSWTSNSAVARQWLDDGLTVVARTVLQGHSGEGIKIINNLVDFVEAPLYTIYVKKSAEYRIHFGDNRIIDIQRKAIRPGEVNPNFQVRTHANGFIYVRKEVEEQLPADVLAQAQRLIQTTPLRHGAIDIIYNKQRDAAYVLEVNTAPGLSGSTINTYRDLFIDSAERLFGQ